MAGIGNTLHLGTSSAGRFLYLEHQQRLEHLSVTGLTGTGKSRYLEGLLRQDIRSWPKTRCGLLLIDPHGAVFDGIMAWLAATKRYHLPVIPIDFRRKDQIVSYNVLRRRLAEPMVVIDAFVKAMAFVFGQAGTDDTPLFERWATNFLYKLYHEGKTLADTAHIFTEAGMSGNDHLTDLLIRRDWQRARQHPEEFARDTASSINRFRRFLLNPTLRAVFGNTGKSLDFGKALEEGQIILVTLARNAGTISRENADLVATLLLTDLWTSAEERGAADDVKPFYVYLDEFQRFLIPTMAESLAEARKFGLGMTMANQFPRQILNSGPYGQRVYDEVMENTRSKVVFRLRTRENLLPVAESLFMDTFDPDRVKYQHSTTKALGQHVAYMPSFTNTDSHTEGGADQHMQSVANGTADTDTWNHTDTAAAGAAVTVTHADGANTTQTNGAAQTETSGRDINLQRAMSSGETSTEGDSITTSKSRTGGASCGASEGTGISHQLGRPKQALVDELTEDDSNTFEHRRPDYRLLARNDSKEVPDERLTNATTSVTLSESQERNASVQWAEANGQAAAKSRSVAHQATESNSQGETLKHAHGRTTNAATAKGRNTVDTTGLTLSSVASSADGRGGSHTDSTTVTHAHGKTSQWSDAHTDGVSWAPMLFSIYGKEANAPLFRAVDEQIFIAMMRIARLKNRQAYVLTPDMTCPEFIRTADVQRPPLSQICVDLCIRWYQRQSGLAKALPELLNEIATRDRAVARGATLPAHDEPAAPYGRRIRK